MRQKKIFYFKSFNIFFTYIRAVWRLIVSFLFVFFIMLSVIVDIVHTSLHYIYMNCETSQITSTLSNIALLNG